MTPIEVFVVFFEPFVRTGHSLLIILGLLQRFDLFFKFNVLLEHQINLSLLSVIFGFQLVIITLEAF